MISGIEKRPVPTWLSDLNNLKYLPIRDVLLNSLYYPSCGNDGDPVRYLGGFIHSFVYVDHGIEDCKVWRDLNDDEEGFKGYQIIYSREVDKLELIPHGWNPIYPRHEDGDPSNVIENIQSPFGIWAIHQRNPDLDDDHGPERFSFLYICGDGVATFQALYHGNNVAPDIVAIVQPGTFNWPKYRKPGRIFSRSVLDNPAGKPQYILYGGWGTGYRPCCWQGYPHLVHYWRTGAGRLGLWRKQLE